MGAGPSVADPLPRGRGEAQAAASSVRGLVDPIVAGDAAVELEVGVELVDLVVGHRGELPIVEHAVLVELLDDLRADASELGEIVGRAARRGQQLEAVGRGRRFARLGLAGGGRRLGQRLRSAPRRRRCRRRPSPGCAKCRRSPRARRGRNKAGSRGWRRRWPGPDRRCRRDRNWCRGWRRPGS